MTIEEIIASISGCAWNQTSLGLDRIRELLCRMGDPQNNLRFVHVAGTNGKGSVCAMLASILQSAGYKTGLYTSPHLCHYNERFRVNGEEITDEHLRELVERTRHYVEQMSEKPTEFEILTAMAMLYFQMKGCDIVVLEVGLGGRLDATNVIPVPETAVIMNIGLEHTEYLGDTLEKIAAEKAGIIKENCSVVAYRSIPSVEAVFENVCREHNATLHMVRFEEVVLLQEGLEGQCFDWGQFQNIQIKLLGMHQIYNAIMALETIKVLKKRGWSVSDEAIHHGLAIACWPARLEVLNHAPLFILDGAHNPQCAEALVSSLATLLPEKKIVFLAGFLADKDYPLILEQVIPLVRQFFCLTPFSERALAAGDLATYLIERGVEATACESIEQGILSALSAAGEDGVVVAFGSLYLAGEVRKCFHRL